MLDARRLPVRAGRGAALVGIVVVALALRQAVAAVSPILGYVRVDVPVPTIGLGLLGTLPPVLFGVSGFSHRAWPAARGSTAASCSPCCSSPPVAR